MSCWLVSALSDIQSGSSNHTAHVVPGGRGPRGDLHRAECAVCSHPPPTLHLLVIWCEMELKLGRITPNSNYHRISPATCLSSHTYQHKVRDILTARVNTDMPSVTQRHCMHKRCSKTQREWDTENMYIFIFLCRYLERVKTFWAFPSEIIRNWHVDSLGKHSTIKLRWRVYNLCGEMHSSATFCFSRVQHIRSFSACHVFWIISLQ